LILTLISNLLLLISISGLKKVFLEYFLIFAVEIANSLKKGKLRREAFITGAIGGSLNKVTKKDLQICREDFLKFL